MGKHDKYKSDLYVSDPMISMSTGVKQVVISSSIKSDNQLIGMTGGTIKWDNIDKQIKIVEDRILKNLKGNARFCILTHTGTYLYHWDKNKNIHIEKDESGKKKINIPKISDETNGDLKNIG